jgi:hypothetical protein
MNRMHPGKPPSQRRKVEPSYYIADGSAPQPIILGDVNIEHLNGSMREIRLAYYEGVVKQALVDPLVLIVHNRSAYAKTNDLVGGPILQFQPMGRQTAIGMGLIQASDEPMKPPSYELLLATGDRIEHHFAVNLTPTWVLDAMHFDPSTRAGIFADMPGVAELVRDMPDLLDKPWLLNDGMELPNTAP